MENLDCITFSTWCLSSVQAPVFDIGFDFLRFWTLSNSITSSCLLNPDPSVSSMNNCLRTNHFSLNYSTLSALYFLCPIRTFNYLLRKTIVRVPFENFLGVWFISGVDSIYIQSWTLECFPSILGIFRFTV